MPAAVADDPIVAIYPVPGEVDPGTDKSPALAPIPTRLERGEAEKAVRRGAFSFTDPTLEDREAAAKPSRPPAEAGKGLTKADLAAAVKDAVDAATKEQADKIAALEAKLAEPPKA